MEKNPLQKKKNPLKEALNQQLKLQNKEPIKIVFVGIGSELRGDDAVGVVIVNKCLASTKLVENSQFKFLNGGSAPENILGEVKSIAPDFIIFIDAALMGEEPGTVKLIDTKKEKISGISFCTHSLPLTIIANYIKQSITCDIFVIGIEPKDMNFRADTALNDEVKQAADLVFDAICSL